MTGDLLKEVQDKKGGSLIIGDCLIGDNMGRFDYFLYIFANALI